MHLARIVLIVGLQHRRDERPDRESGVRQAVAHTRRDGASERLCPAPVEQGGEGPHARQLRPRVLRFLGLFNLATGREERDLREERGGGLSLLIEHKGRRLGPAKLGLCGVGHVRDDGSGWERYDAHGERRATIAKLSSSRVGPYGLRASSQASARLGAIGNVCLCDALEEGVALGRAVRRQPAQCLRLHEHVVEAALGARAYGGQKRLELLPVLVAVAHL